MEEKDEFSDILLEKDENKASKFKKIALGVGVLVLIFLVVIIVMKIINKPDSKEDDSRLVIQPTTNQNEPESSTSKDDPLFKQVPIIQEDSKKESFEEMVKKLKEKETKRAKEEESEPKKDEKSSKKDEIAKEAAKDVPAPESAMKPVPIKEIKQPKKQPKKEKVAKKKKAKPAPAKSASSGTYIQVLASTKMNPDKKFVAKVKAKGYPYRLYKTEVKGTPYLKVLVGPYNSQKEARETLVKVKKELNPDAFIFHVK